MSDATRLTDAELDQLDVLARNHVFAYWIENLLTRALIELTERRAAENSDRQARKLAEAEQIPLAESAEALCPCGSGERPGDCGCETGPYGASEEQ